MILCLKVNKNPGSRFIHTHQMASLKFQVPKIKPNIIGIWGFPVHGGTPKSSIFIDFSIINNPFWGTPISGNHHIEMVQQHFPNCITWMVLDLIPSGRQTWLAGKFPTGWWFGTFGLFFHILGIMIPTDFHIFQRGRYTTNQPINEGSLWEHDLQVGDFPLPFPNRRVMIK